MRFRAETRGRKRPSENRAMREKVADVATAIQEGVALFQKGDWENALNMFLSAQSENPNETLEIVYYTGLCYAKLKCFAEAQPYLEKFIHESHENVRVYQCRMTLAYTYVMTKKSKMAVYAFPRRNTRA
jgi:tetratricopeptide (TPR) repeat protein